MWHVTPNVDVCCLWYLIPFTTTKNDKLQKSIWEEVKVFSPYLSYILTLEEQPFHTYYTALCTYVDQPRQSNVDPE